MVERASPRVHALATKRGFWVTLVLLGVVTVAAASEFRRYAHRILDVRDVIELHQSVRSQSALNEIARLNTLIVTASRIDEPSRKFEEIETALAVLRERSRSMTGHIDALLASKNASEVEGSQRASRDGVVAVNSVNALVEGVEEALQSDDPKSGLLEERLLLSLNKARRAVFLHFDQTTELETGLLALLSKKVNYLNRATLVFLAAVGLAGTASLFFIRREILAREQRERAERRADKLAYFDSLTGLANRVQFQDKVDEFLSPTAKGALVLIDLDGFKEINDRHGHAMGDAVLKQIARSIRREAEKHGGMAARLGGDEFAVFMETDNTAFLMDFCQALVDVGSKAVEFGGTRVHPGVSVGMATTTQVSISRRLRYDHMMRVADFALYASKGAGRGRYTLYDADLESVMAERRALMKELPKAIQTGELEVYLQPKVLLATGEVTGFEALVRWRRNGAVLNPGQFIQIAEDSNRICEVDAYVLDRAVEIIADWNNRYRTDYSVSVNLSGEHFRTREPLPFVAEALARHNFDPKLLTLEITETVQLENWDIVKATVADLKEIGCRISIDDFGTGYSSLVYLRTISADELKIDKSLIDEIEHSSEAQFILDAVIDLADSLSLEVVVEGIERPEQHQMVNQLGCKSGQGYLFGRPGPANEALADATYAHPELKRVGRG